MPVCLSACLSVCLVRLFKIDGVPARENWTFYALSEELSNIFLSLHANALNRGGDSEHIFCWCPFFFFWSASRLEGGGVHIFVYTYIKYIIEGSIKKCVVDAKSPYIGACRFSDFHSSRRPARAILEN